MSDTIIGKPAKPKRLRVAVTCQHPFDGTTYVLEYVRDGRSPGTFVIPDSLQTDLGVTLWLKVDAEMKYISQAYPNVDAEGITSSLKMLRDSINNLIKICRSLP